MDKVKITVVKCLSTNEIFGLEKLGCSTNASSKCGMFTEGQEFITDMSKVPEGFCPHAFSDITQYILGIGQGVNFDWMNEEGKVLACCTDGFRPVVFRIERMDN